MFFSRFIAGNVFCSLLALTLMLIKKLLGKRLPPAYHYRIWLLLMLALGAVFLPARALRPFQSAGVGREPVSFSESADLSEGVTAFTRAEVYDAVALAGETEAANGLRVIWAVGAALNMGLYARGALTLGRLRRGAEAVDGRAARCLEKCRERLKLRRKVRLLQSPGVRTPMSFGIAAPCIVLPSGAAEELTETELEHILMHELVHIRRFDGALNYAACLFGALYWCNPVVRLALGQLRRDREAYCDWSVLCGIGSRAERLSYGYTLLRFAGGRGARVACAESGLGGGAAQLRYRIELISQFRGRTKKGAACGIAALTAAAALCALGLPVLAEFSEGADIYVPERPITVENGDYGTIFGEREGCAVVCGMEGERYTVYGDGEITRRVPACSTYKIFSALNALEQGIITPESNAMAWDGTPQPFAAWRGGQDLRSAMQNSVNWYFRNLDAMAGDTLGEFYERIGYGNAGRLGRGGDYREGADLKISPLEQVELLRGLYDGSIGCDEQNAEAVRGAMLISESGGVRLYGKTGTGKTGETQTLGWFVGWAETEERVCFFAVNVSSPEGASGADAEEIALEILGSMGIKL